MAHVSKKQFLAQFAKATVQDLADLVLKDYHCVISTESREEALNDAYRAYCGESLPNKPLPAAPNSCTHEVKCVGVEMCDGYRRAGLVLSRQWQPFVLDAEQVVRLKLDPRVAVKEI